EFHFERERYVPSIYGRSSEAPPFPSSDPGVPMAPAMAESAMQVVESHAPVSAPDESPVANLQAAPLPVSTPTESSVAAPFPERVEPVPAIAAQHQMDAVLPDPPARADVLAAAAEPLIARQTINRGAVRIRKRKPSLGSHVLATLRDSWPKEPLAPEL